MKIRPARRENIPRILEIYAAARGYMAAHGNPTQWGSDYPPRGLLEADLAQGNLYTVEDGSGIHAAFALVPGADPTYTRIDGGAWLSDSAYMTLHRVASDGRVHGVFREIVDFSSRNHPHLRIDTHEDNAGMRRLIAQSGFRERGRIYVRDGSPRIAYERIGYGTENTLTVTVDRPLGSCHPNHADLVYPVNYGYLPGFMAPDGEEQDAYIVGISEPVQTFTGKLTAVVHRFDDVEEKWVIAPEGMTLSREEIEEQVHFQEQYFHTEIRI